MSVYILHLDTPLYHARHYIGWSKNMFTLKKRVGHHADGTARCKFTDAVHRAGITFQLARVFRGRKYDRNFERKLKNRTHIKEYCPVCSGGIVKEYHPRRNHDRSI